VGRVRGVLKKAATQEIHTLARDARLEEKERAKTREYIQAREC
jgi:hypothetical protein